MDSHLEGLLSWDFMWILMKKFAWKILFCKENSFFLVVLHNGLRNQIHYFFIVLWFSSNKLFAYCYFYWKMLSCWQSIITTPKREILFLFHFMVYHFKNVYTNRIDEGDSYYQPQLDDLKKLIFWIFFLCMIV